MNEVTVRPAAVYDIGEIMRIIDGAKRFLKDCGVDQWQDGFPCTDVITADILSREAFVVLSDGFIAAYVCLSTEPEAAYITPKSGRFSLPGEYCTIHRTAVSDDYRGKGLSHILFSVCTERCAAHDIPNLRVDTHRDNARMRHIITREGFTECAVVTLENGGERVAYEKRVI